VSNFNKIAHYFVERFFYLRSFSEPHVNEIVAAFEFEISDVSTFLTDALGEEFVRFLHRLSAAAFVAGELLIDLVTLIYHS